MLVLLYTLNFLKEHFPYHSFALSKKNFYVCLCVDIHWSYHTVECSLCANFCAGLRDKKLVVLMGETDA